MTNTYRGTPSFGQNAAYDKQQEEVLERKRAFYRDLDRRIALERTIEQATKELTVVQARYDRAKRVTDRLRQRANELKMEIDVKSRALKSRTRKEKRDARQEAIDRGEKTYVTGDPCRNGHYAPRYVTSGACVACDRAYSRVGYTRRDEST